jgi:hypothetical protein
MQPLATNETVLTINEEEKMLRKVLLFAACMVLLLAGVAQADYLRLETSGVDFTNLTIHDPAMAPGGTTGTVAGRFTVDFGPSTSSFTKYQAFCVDPATVNWNTWYNSYTMIDLPDLVPYKQAAYIYDKYGNLNASAAQIAIWEVVFEGLSGGTPGATDADLQTQYEFYATNINATDLADAKSYLTDALANGSNYSNGSYHLLVSSSTQGYYLDPWQDWIVRVPEPGVLTLLGLGLVALGITRRRTK